MISKRFHWWQGRWEWTDVCLVNHTPIFLSVQSWWCHSETSGELFYCLPFQIFEQRGVTDKAISSLCNVGQVTSFLRNSGFFLKIWEMKEYKHIDFFQFSNIYILTNKVLISILFFKKAWVMPKLGTLLFTFKENMRLVTATNSCVESATFQNIQN